MVKAMKKPMMKMIKETKTNMKPHKSKIRSAAAKAMGGKY